MVNDFVLNYRSPTRRQLERILEAMMADLDGRRRWIIPWNYVVRRIVPHRDRDVNLAAARELYRIGFRATGGHRGGIPRLSSELVRPSVLRRIYSFHMDYHVGPGLSHLKR